MANTPSVLIDCEKIKNPHNGLYHFCTELVRAMQEYRAEFDITPRVAIKHQSTNELPGVTKQFLTLFDKIHFRCRNGEQVFHQTFQMGKYMPRNAKTVLTIHDLNYLYEKTPDRWVHYDQKIRRNIARADHVVFISNFVKNNVFERFGDLGKPCSVIYNGCCTFAGEENAHYTPQAYHPAAEFLFSVGVIFPKKNFHVLPPLLVGNDLELVIAGSETTYAETILREAAKYGVSDRVKIIGTISEEDKDWYYRHCKAFVLPSIAEGFGLPTIEAMSYGKPVFLSRHTSLPEIGGSYAYYFDHDFDPLLMRKQFSEGLADFAAHDPEGQILHAKSFSWQETARQYAAIYHAVISKK